MRKSVTVVAFGLLVAACYPHLTSRAQAAEASLQVDELPFWERHFEGADVNSRDIALLWKVSVGSDGGVCAAGHIESGPYGAKRYSRPWVVRIEPNGEQSWEKLFDSDRLDTAETVAATPDGGCLLGVGKDVAAGRTEAQFVLLDKYGNELWRRTIASERSTHPAWAIVGSNGTALIVVDYDQKDAVSPPKSLALGFSSSGQKAWEMWLPGKVTGLIPPPASPILGIWQRKGEGQQLELTAIDPGTGALSKAFSKLVVHSPSAPWASDGSSVAVIVTASGNSTNRKGPKLVLDILALDGHALGQTAISQTDGNTEPGISHVDAVVPAWHGAFLVIGQAPNDGGIAVVLANADGVRWRSVLRTADVSLSASSEAFDAARTPNGDVLIVGASSRNGTDGWWRSVWLRHLHP